jgi:protoheme IX farnesyltransferase
VVAGALTGALPPLIGWVAAGGGILDRPIVFIGFLLFMGQIPHFWLLIVKYGEEYKSAGMPNLTGLFSTFQIKRLTFTWVLTSVIAALFLCLFEIIQISLITIVLVIASGFLIWKFTGLLKDTEIHSNISRYSILLNSYFLLIMILLISDRLITGG